MIRSLCPQKKGHPGFKIVDLDYISKQLREHGFDVEAAKKISGFRRIFTVAPFGNKIEFLQAEE